MYVELHTIEEALEKEFNRLAQPVLEGNAKTFDNYRERIGELKGIRIAATVIGKLFSAARGA